MTQRKLSVIIPCYNEESVIEMTFSRLKEMMKINHFTNHELLFINDGSRDRTLEILRRFAAKDKKTSVISFSRNFGHQPAVSAGLSRCTGEIAVIIDADLQDPPRLIPDMIKVMEKEKCNVVYAVRIEREGETVFKRLTANLFYRIINYMSEIDIPKNTGDFRLIDRKVIDCFNSLPEREKFIRGLISWIGFKQSPFYYTREPRAAGETKYPLSKMLKFAATGIKSFSIKPLKIAFSLGVFCVLIGLALTIFVFISKFFLLQTATPGWASTMILIIFFGGVQMLSIGVLGEYIGSIFLEMKGRPEFIIDEEINTHGTGRGKRR